MGQSCRWSGTPAHQIHQGLYRRHSLQFRYKWIGGGFYPPHILIKEAWIIIHKAGVRPSGQPDLVSYLPDPDILPGKHRAEVDLAIPDTDSPSLCFV